MKLYIVTTWFDENTSKYHLTNKKKALQCFDVEVNTLRNAECRITLEYAEQNRDGIYSDPYLLKVHDTLL